MASKAVAKQEAQVPDLIRTPALEITAEDVALPRLYIGQYTSQAVKDQLVKPGSIYAATGQDDPEPVILATAGKEGVALDDGVIVHILALKKGKSYSEGPGEELQLFDYDDPSAPAEAWVTYNYTVAVPEHDTDVPHKWLLTRTGRPAAKQLNTVLAKNQARCPAYEIAFKFGTAKRSNQKGEFFVARVAQVEAVPANVEVAQNLAVMIAGASSDYGQSNEEPEI